MPDFVRARCRLIPDFWKLAAICGVMLLLLAAAAITQPPRGFEGWSVCAVMLITLGATPFHWLVASRRGCIEFDANGARWRTAFGGWKSARWDEIESCDARLNSDGGKIKHWKFVVQTRNGAFSWTNSFENADQLAPFAARFCPLIPANPADWLGRFHYRSGENIILPLAFLFLIVVFVGAIAKWLIRADWNYLAAQIQIYVALYGWLLTLAGFALFGVIIFAVPALLFSVHFNMARQNWQRRNESFLATTEGLSWRVGGRERLFAAWDELQVLHTEARGRLVAVPFFRLQSARGEFSWAGSLSGSAQLSRTCFERVPQLQSEVQARLREELHQTRDEAGEVLTFDFKARTLRAILWGGVCFSAFTWGITVFGPLQPANGSEPAPTWLTGIVAVIVTAMTIYGVQLFRRGYIVLDARGIEWRLPLRQQFVAWDEINALLVDKKLFLQVGARRVPLGTHDMYPTRLNLLMKTIAARATNAGGAWKSADETEVAQTAD